MAQKTFTLSQALDYLENLEVSSEFEEESLGDLQFSKIYLQPPLNSNRPSSDVDSGDKNTAASYTSNLSGNQFLSAAVLKIKCPSGKVILGKVKILRKNACSKSKTAKEIRFTPCEQMDSFRHFTSNWF